MTVLCLSPKAGIVAQVGTGGCACCARLLSLRGRPALVRLAGGKAPWLGTGWDSLAGTSHSAGLGPPTALRALGGGAPRNGDSEHGGTSEEAEGLREAGWVHGVPGGVRRVRSHLLKPTTSVASGGAQRQPAGESGQRLMTLMFCFPRVDPCAGVLHNPLAGLSGVGGPGTGLAPPMEPNVPLCRA